MILTKITVHSYFSILNRFSTKTYDSRFWNPCLKINAVAFVMDAWWKQGNRYMSNCPASLETTLRTWRLTEEHTALNHGRMCCWCVQYLSPTQRASDGSACVTLCIWKVIAVFQKGLTSQIRLPLSLSLLPLHPFPSSPHKISHSLYFLRFICSYSSYECIESKLFVDLFYLLVSLFLYPFFNSIKLLMIPDVSVIKCKLQE